VARDQQVIRALNSQHFESHQDRGDDHGVNAVDSNAIHALQPGERRTLLVREARIGSHFSYRAAGFNPAKNVFPCQVLVLN
jgi:hypothetical protein